MKDSDKKKLAKELVGKYVPIKRVKKQGPIEKILSLMLGIYIGNKLVK